MKVAIVTCYDKENYGSMLQAYATQEFLESKGVDTTTVDKSGVGRVISAGRRHYYCENALNISLYKAKMGFVLHRVRRRLSPTFAAKFRTRRSAFRRFSERHFRLSRVTASFSELADYCMQFDAVVVGSDQLWLPVNISGGYFTLSFLPDTVRTIAYATSFGVAQLPSSYEDRAREFLGKFDSISVREESGRSIIAAILGKHVDVVCDPTMLLTPDQWESVENMKFALPSEPYVLCYFLGKNIWNRECAERIANEMGCRIVALVHLDEYVAYDETYADCTPYDVAPDDFLRLVRNASYVCTDSFHGTVFSILFKVPFFCFRRHENVGLESTNSRMDTLLGRYALTNRIIESPAQFEAESHQPIDFERVHLELAEFRSQSARFILGALGPEAHCGG